MAAWGEFSERIASIRTEWNKAESDVKLAEQVCERVVFPSIKELRYAGRRIVDALHGVDSAETEADRTKLVDLLIDAEFDCLRARHDAIDAATSHISVVITIAAKKIGYETIFKVLPEFRELRVMVNEIRAKIAASRENRGNRDSIYSSVSSADFPHLVTLYQKFQQNEAVMKEMAKKQRIHRVASYGLGVAGVLYGVIEGFFI